MAEVDAAADNSCSTREDADVRSEEARVEAISSAPPMSSPGNPSSLSRLDPSLATQLRWPCARTFIFSVASSDLNNLNLCICCGSCEAMVLDVWGGGTHLQLMSEVEFYVDAYQREAWGLKYVLIVRHPSHSSLQPISHRDTSCAI
jgi:hypothetical protein